MFAPPCITAGMIVIKPAGCLCHRNAWSLAVMVLACVSAMMGQLATAAEHSRAPNIVLIYADDMGYGDLGCYGASGVKTPNCDRLAAEGLRLTAGYATSATCTPSRYSLMTGEYAWRRKGTGVLPGDAALIIEPGRNTLPALLAQAGYRTGVVGKWHLGLGTSAGVDWNGKVAPGPREIGFQSSFIMAATGDRVPCVYVKDHGVFKLDPADPIRVSYQQPFPGERLGTEDRASLKMNWSHGHNMAVINGIGRIGYMTGGKAALWVDENMADDFAREAVAFLEASRSEPFFLYFATQDVHVPRVPHPRFVGKSGQGPRGDALVEFDDSVGKILETLDRLGLSENTLVMVTSDNGPVLDDGYVDDANEKLGAHRPAGPFRGGKYSLFEGGTRVPWLVRWPARVKPGTSDALISQVDLIASLGALVGVEPAAETSPDSQNVLAALLGESPQGRDFVLEHAGQVAIRDAQWKYIPPAQTREGLGPWKTTKIAEPGLLFHLAADPSEQQDVAAEHPDRVSEMRARLRALRGAGQ